MKLYFVPSRLTRAETLVITLITALVIGTVLASSLTLINTQHRATSRSLSWNSAIPIAEAGVEEALAHLEGDGHRAASGWVQSGSSYEKRRDLNDGYSVVRITLADPPTITSQGFAPLALCDSKYVSRTIEVTTTRAALFGAGIVSRRAIDLNGNSVRTDSFDSADPNYSLLGLYVPWKAKDNGDVYSNDTVTNSLNVGNADVYGHVGTGPGGSVTVGPNGGVGSAVWHAAGNHGVQDGYVANDVNLQISDVSPPFTSGGLTPLPGIVDGVAYTYVLRDGNYQMSELTMNGSGNMAVAGNATLYVTGDVKINGVSTVVILPGGKLNMYVGGSDTAITALVGVDNTVGRAQNFYYYGLPNNRNITLTGNGQFTGAVYAPSADVQLAGGGNLFYGFAGAIVANSVRINGNFNFHYDENLARVGPFRGYKITGWREL